MQPLAVVFNELLASCYPERGPSRRTNAENKGFGERGRNRTYNLLIKSQRMKLQVGAHFEITQLSVLEVIARYNFGTTGRRKNSFLVPKRHQMKHLGFWIFWFGTRGSEVQILSPRSFFLAIPQITCAAFAARFFGDFGHIRSDFLNLSALGNGYCGVRPEMRQSHSIASSILRQVSVPRFLASTFASVDDASRRKPLS